MSHSFTHGYALLIGVDENCAGGYALPDVAKDIRALAEVLVHPQRCAYPTDNVKQLTGQEATRQGIVGGLGWLREHIQADASGNTTAVVYYSGHGISKASAGSHRFYLVPYDFDQGMIELSALQATDFSRAVSALNPQRLLVVLDCCHAGGMGVKGTSPLPAGFAGAAIAPSLLMEDETVFVGPQTKGAKGMEALAQGSGRAVLSSSTGKQLSYIRKDEQMSIFTYHLIESLTGHAQPQEGATEVLVSDVMSHVWRQVPRSARSDWNMDQTPDYQVSGNFPIALLLGGKGLSKGQPAPDPLDLLAGERQVRGEQHIQTATGSYIAQADRGGTAIVGSEKAVLGDNIEIGRIGSMTGSVVGSGSVQADVIAGRDQTTMRFDDVYRRIRERPDDPDIDKAELTEQVQRIQTEVDKGAGANPNKITRWLSFLADMAPDIFDVTVAMLTNPGAGVATIIKKTAQRARDEFSQSGGG